MMKRSYDSYMGGPAQPPNPSKRQACEGLDSYMIPYTEPSFPPLNIEHDVSRQTAMNHLTQCDEGSAPLLTQPWSLPPNPYLDTSYPALNTLPPYQSTSNPAPSSMASPEDLKSDHTLEFEIQREMGMVWREDDTTSLGGTSSLQSSPGFSAPTADFIQEPFWFPSWQNQAANVSQLPIGPAPVMIPDLAQAPPQMQQLPSPLHPSAPANLVDLGNDLRAHARSQARLVEQELAHTAKGT